MQGTRRAGGRNEGGCAGAGGRLRAMERAACVREGSLALGSARENVWGGREGVRARGCE